MMNAVNIVIHLKWQFLVMWEDEMSVQREMLFFFGLCTYEKLSKEGY